MSTITQVVSAVRALAEAEGQERTAVAALDQARHGVAHGIVSVGRLMMEDGAPSQRKVAQALTAEGVKGWSQSTLSRTVVIFRAATMVGAVDGEDGPNVDEILTVRSVVVERYQDKDGKANVPGSKIVGLLLGQEDLTPGKGPWASAMALHRSAAKLAKGETLAKRSDAGVAREPGAHAGTAPDTTDNSETPGRSTGNDGHGPDDGPVTTLAQDTVTAMRGWTSHLRGAAATTVPGSITRDDAYAMVAGLTDLISAAEAVLAAVEAAVDGPQEQEQETPKPAARKGRSKATAAA